MTAGEEQGKADQNTEPEGLGGNPQRLHPNSMLHPCMRETALTPSNCPIFSSDKISTSLKNSSPAPFSPHVYGICVFNKNNNNKETKPNFSVAVFPNSSCIPTYREPANRMEWF